MPTPDQAELVLVREWKHKSHRVVVLADGFAYDGRTFANLSEIAVLITEQDGMDRDFWSAAQDARRRNLQPDPSSGPKRKVGTTSARSSHLGGGGDYRKRSMPKTAKSGSEGSHRGR